MHDLLRTHGSGTRRAKWGWEENSGHLLLAAGQLVLVRDFQPYGSRKLQLQQCPECGC